MAVQPHAWGCRSRVVPHGATSRRPVTVAWVAVAHTLSKAPPKKNIIGRVMTT